jgi:hypothetical protein
VGIKCVANWTKGERFMTDEKKDSIDEEKENKVKVENLPEPERELTTEEAEALKGGNYTITNAWPKKYTG